MHASKPIFWSGHSIARSKRAGWFMMAVLLHLNVFAQPTISPTGQMRAPFVGGWFHEDHDPHTHGGIGTWLNITDDGTWSMTLDNGGLRLTRTGRWAIKNGEAEIVWRAGITASHYRVSGDQLLSSDTKPGNAWEKRAAPPAELLALPLVPRTVNEAVAMIKEKLPLKSKEEIADMMEDQLIVMHFGLGTWIRNMFGLWGGNSDLLESCGSRTMNPDSASMVILRALWESLRSDRPDYSSLHALETRLFALRVEPFAIRDLSFPAIVQRLNEATRLTLRAAGQPENGLVFVLSDGDQTVSDEVRNRRFSYYMLLKPWGTSRHEVAKPVPPLEMLQFCDTHLRLPSTVQVVPRYESGWFTDGNQSIFEEGMWRGDTFDVVTTPPSASSKSFPLVQDPSRVSFWKMKGRAFPMPVIDAVRVFKKSKAAKPDEKLNQISIESESADGETLNGGISLRRVSAAPKKDHSDKSKVWEYKVTASPPADQSFDAEKFEVTGQVNFSSEEQWFATLKAKAFSEACSWRQYDQPPRISPDKAIRAMKKYLKSNFMFSGQEVTESIVLNRLEQTDLWYYEVCLDFPDGLPIKFVRGFVLLDGRVIPFLPKPKALNP